MSCAPSPTAARFRALVTHFMSPTQSFRLHSYSDGEAQLRDDEALDDTEWRRLTAAAPAQARELLQVLAGLIVRLSV